MDNEKQIEGVGATPASSRAAGEWGPQAEVARRVAVSRQSVSNWRSCARRRYGGAATGRALGRPRKLSAAQCQELMGLLKSGALAAGFATELWTLPRMGADRGALRGEPANSVWRRCSGWAGACSGQRVGHASRIRQLMQWKQKRWPALKKSLRGKDE